MIADRRGSASASAEAARAHEGLGRDASTSSKEVLKLCNKIRSVKANTQLKGIHKKGIHNYMGSYTNIRNG